MSIEAMKEALEKIANVNATDYEYQQWAREALAIAAAAEKQERESNEAKAWFTVDEFNEWVEKLIEKEKDKWLNLMSGQKNQ